MRQAPVCLALLVMFGGTTGLVQAKEKQSVTITYVVGPSRPLGEGLRAVAVINSGVSTQGMKQDDREARWSTMAADMVEAMLQAGSSMMPQPIAVAKRSETQAVLREHDMALAGLVAGDQAATAGKLLAVQALITSRITINIDEQRGTKSTLDWMSIMGGAMRETTRGRGAPVVAPAPAPAPVVQPRQRTEVRRGPDGRQYVVQRQGAPVVRPSPRYRGNPSQVYVPRGRGTVQHERSVAGGGLTLATKDVEEISRHLTVQCSFTLIDAASGQALLQYSPPPMQKHDQKSPDFLFGGAMGAEDLDPVDHFIGELVEQSTREFVSMIVPVQMSCTYELVARHSAAEDALRALRADDYAGAMAGLQRELAKYPDEPETLFAMGAVFELMGKPEQALEYYRRTVSSKDVDEDDLPTYLGAKDRLSAHMGRIIQPGAAVVQPSVPTAGPVNQPPAVPPANPTQAPPAQPAAVPAPIVEESVIKEE